MNEPDLSDVLIEILAFARSGPPVEELLSYFTTRALTVVSGTVVVRPLRHAPRPPLTAGAGPGNAKAFPVSCGRVPWGELQLTDDDGPVADGDAHRGHLLAEVLGAALAADAEAGAPAARDPHTTAFLSSAGNPGDDDMVELVLGCVEDLDRMPDASTRARLALVVGRVADVVGAPAWSVGLSHHGWLHDVSGAPGPDGAVIDDPAAATGPVPIARFPARRRASG
ncbi:MAG TPA: hypothetical protein VLQ78_01205 [Ornithinibacter sp.]|nr:hypothetical protein [Ornithinibacter sp.]